MHTPRICGWFCWLSVTALALAASPALSQDPGDLFPNVGFQRESESDGTEAANKPPPAATPEPQPVVIEIKPAAEASATPASSGLAVGVSPTAAAQPSSDVAPPTTTAAAGLPWFVRCTESADELQAIARDPRSALPGVLAWASKSPVLPDEKELLIAVAEYSAGKRPAALRRLQDVQKTADAHRARAAMLYSVAIQNYADALFRREPIADPRVFRDAMLRVADDRVRDTEIILKSVNAAIISGIPDYNAVGVQILQARNALTLADYIVPRKSHRQMAEKIIDQEIALRQLGIQLLMQRAQRRRQKIDELAQAMSYNRRLGWQPAQLVQAVNTFVDGIAADQARGRELINQLKEYAGKSGRAVDIAKLTALVDNGARQEIPIGTGRKSPWFDLARLYSAVPRDASTGPDGRPFATKKVLTVNVVRINPEPDNANPPAP